MSAPDPSSAGTMAADRPSAGARRARAIEDYGVLQGDPRPELQSIAELAAHLCGVSMAAINLITDSEQHQVATYGFDAAVHPQEDALCAVTVRTGEPLVLSDASADPRLRQSPFVNGDLGRVRFYAAHPLLTPGGVVIGTLCAFDVEPRELAASERELLASLAQRVVELLELERRTRDLAATVEELRAAQAELERSNEQLASFAGQVAHDLRNPLTAMGMSLQLLREEVRAGAGDREELLWLAQRAISGTERMQALVDELLDFASLGAGLALTDVDLAGLLEEVRADLAPALAGATLEVGDLPTVRGDRVQLRMLMQNLLANAVKFTRPGEPPRIEVAAHRDADACELEVRDHGIGIPPEDRERVLEPFVRLDRRTAGSGIGLATCRRVVRAHGGSIELGETPGGGTTVRVRLPVAPDASPAR